ncbi:GNAT family N-acetyltransferase [Sphingorhabdus sp. EL138]|uniref:GNAT family N-acetyltransferase n=1 Tax=Sphingorhabdus sp. EL138 TaxID=2073156 RepID=UPI0013A57FA0|nr:GNAT family N-acetyltransferase [Sphingorhabdus sp. EL138]
MNIRPAEDRDRPVIAEIHARSWQENYRDYLCEDLLDNQLSGMMAERWRNAEIGRQDIVLVAEDDRVQGFVAVWDDEMPYIDNLHVRSEGRSKGIGRKLLAAAARAAKANGRKAIWLHVVVGNDRARSLYTRLGGAPDGIEDKDLYGTMVPNERIIWRDIDILVEQSN